MAKRKGLPSHIVKKYGMTKKAWRIFKSGKKPTRTKTKTKRRRTRTMPKKKSYRKRIKAKLTMEKALIGGFGVVIADQVANQVLANMNINISDDIVKFGIGMYASRRPGMVGGMGKALAYVNASRLLGNINIGNILGGSAGTAGTNGDGW